RKADPRSRRRVRPDRTHRQAVAEDRMMRGLVEPRRRELQARRVHALLVAVADEDVRFVEGEEASHAVAQLPGDMAGVIGERLRRLAPLPAAKTILQR